MSRFRTFEISDPRFETEHLRDITVKSRNLGRRADITLFVPGEPERSIGSLLILLHGVYGSHWSWTRKAGVHRTALRLIEQEVIAPLVIAMSSDGLWGDGSGYLPHPDGDAERWIAEEVIQAAQEGAPALVEAPKLFLGGISMGGYGALRIGAKYASRFAGLSAHSAITCIQDLAGFVEEPLDAYTASCSAEELDPLFWMRRNRNDLPPIRFDCVTEDSLLRANRALAGALSEERIPHAYFEHYGGHEWNYWEAHIEDTLRFVDRISRNSR